MGTITATIELDPTTGAMLTKTGDPQVARWLEERLGSHAVDKPAALAEELADAKTEAGGVISDFYFPPATLRDIAVSVSYGVLSKDDATKASHELLRRQGLLEREATS